MDGIVFFVLGFLACFIVIAGWVSSALDEARDAYQRAINLNRQTQAMLDEDATR